MKQTEEHIEAPTIQCETLWKMSPVEFNNWRQINDYPRIAKFLIENLPLFPEWMIDQKITKENLIEHSPSTFLKERELIYLYEITDKDSIEKQVILTKSYKIGESYFFNNRVKNKTKIIPYPNWYRKNSKTKERLNLRVTVRKGRNHYFMGKLGLIDLGNYQLQPNYYIGDRNLDFVSIDDLKINYANNNKHVRLWFSSAVNVSIKGDLAFIDAYKTSFYEVFNAKYSNLKLSGGTFQDWTFMDCQIRLNATNANLFRWKIVGYDFKAGLNLCDIRESSFSAGKQEYSISYGRTKDFHAHIKRLYSQLGKRKEASRHYFLERKFQRKSYLRAAPNYNEEFNSITKYEGFLLPLFYAKYFVKYLLSLLLNILWGYGEKPSRVFIISFITIALFSIIYFYSPCSSPELRGDVVESFYYSLVTFTTLGAGDIIQTDGVLKIITGIESLFGISFWGILIAGFANNSKDY